MAHVFAAYIPPQHYETFRDIFAGNCPHTYDEWVYLHTQKLADHCSKGYACDEVEVAPEEFLNYLGTHGGDRNLLYGLDHFALWKATHTTR